jgi:cytochrome c oxidase subunit 2
LQRHKQRILDLSENELNGLSQWEAGNDDRIVKGEFHIPVGQEVEFVFRSQDVIHSAYMPHFRAQMNTVPGMPTRFKMKPTITTAEMRKKMGNDKFDYILLCNKVCGAAHFNMKMTVIVDTPEDYAVWLAQQKTFGGSKEAPSDSTGVETPKADTLTMAANH